MLLGKVTNTSGEHLGNQERGDATMDAAFRVTHSQSGPRRHRLLSLSLGASRPRAFLVSAWQLGRPAKSLVRLPQFSIRAPLRAVWKDAQLQNDSGQQSSASARQGHCRGPRRARDVGHCGGARPHARVTPQRAGKAPGRHQTHQRQHHPGRQVQVHHRSRSAPDRPPVEIGF
jgi:hypothetical protein